MKWTRLWKQLNVFNPERQVWGKWNPTSIFRNSVIVIIEIINIIIIIIIIIISLSLSPAPSLSSSPTSIVITIVTVINHQLLSSFQKMLTPEVYHSTWKMMVGRRSFPFGKGHFQGLLLFNFQERSLHPFPTALARLDPIFSRKFSNSQDAQGQNSFSGNGWSLRQIWLWRSMREPLRDGLPQAMQANGWRSHP